MNDKLIEAVARAIYSKSGDARAGARAALAAIEASGTHVVAPLNADGQMVGEWRQSQASDVTEWLRSMAEEHPDNSFELVSAAEHIEYLRSLIVSKAQP